MADVEDKACTVCGHPMELVTREREDTIEVPTQWECSCGHRQPHVAAKEWGEA